MTGHGQLGTALDALAHPYRRQLLRALLESNPQYVDEVASDAGDAASAASEVERHHVHLPKLADQGFIHWDRNTGAIRKGPNWDAVAPLVELMEIHGNECPADWL